MAVPKKKDSGIENGEHDSGVPAFAPDDPLDGMDVGQWRSRYPSQARKGINTEAAYLGILLLIVPLGMTFLWLEYPRTVLTLSPEEYRPLRTYGTAWLGGLLGGSLFAIKWLYHSVARNIWHEDRRLWRILAPHISGGLAFAMIAVIASGLFKIFSQEVTNSLTLVVGMSFLVGYFSDSAVAKLTEIAQTVFGSRHEGDHVKIPSITAKDEDIRKT